MKGLIIVAIIGLFLTAVLAGNPSFAVNPSEVLKDPALETRARDVSQNLRCLVCQNQSIDDSDAELARDLRLLVRERIQAGDTNTQVTDYVVSRYGDFVLLKPPFKASTIVLWVGPAVAFIAGMIALILFFRPRYQVTASSTQPQTNMTTMTTMTALSEDDRKRLDKLMGNS
jgi:cytochrome c-type biogenesis protein CcmH